jgi:hypothetical protein
VAKPEHDTGICIFRLSISKSQPAAATAKVDENKDEKPKVMA